VTDPGEPGSRTGGDACRLNSHWHWESTVHVRGTLRRVAGQVLHPRFKKEAEVRKKLSATWVEFPGIVPSLW
jgi:hypothetical protein